MKWLTVKEEIIEMIVVEDVEAETEEIAMIDMKGMSEMIGSSVQNV